MTVLVETTDLTPDPQVAGRVAEARRRRLGVELLVELVAAGATAPHTGIESRQKPIRLIDARRDTHAGD
jgi:phenylacetate-CoA ligase